MVIATFCSATGTATVALAMEQLSAMNSKHTYSMMLAFLFTHEVDAAFRHEWRMLPLTSFLPEDVGREVFIWLHVPLYAGILSFGDRMAFRTGLAAFSVVHVGLHWLYRTHPANEFNNPSSWALILGAGLFGAAYLFQAYARRRTH
eukprot:Opistho-2@88730